MALATAASAATFKPAELVKDIETALIPVGSQPRTVCARDENSTLLTIDDEFRVKLWRTNGTTASTALIRDFGILDEFADAQCVLAGTTGQQFVLLITGNDVSLLAIDATASSAVEVLRSSDGNWPALVGVASLPVFALPQADSSIRLMVSDGTVAGTSQLAVLPPSPSGFPALVINSSIEMGGKVYFGSSGNLWESNGTIAGTRVTATLPAGAAGDPYLSSFQRLGSGFIFVRQGVDAGELWGSDGTGAGTRLLSTFGSDQEPRVLQDVTPLGNGLAVFTVRDFVNGDGNGELWRTNGSAAGTVRVNAAPDLAVTDLVLPLRAGGAIFKGITAAYGREPWFTDGTDAGTRLIRDFAPGPDESFTLLQQAGLGALVVNTGNIYDPWYTDGTPAGTWSLAAVEPRLSTLGTSFIPFVSLGSRHLFLTVSSGAPGYDFTLWRLDPANRSVVSVRQFVAPADSPVSVSISNTAPVHGLGLLAMYDPVRGFEPWVTDGTAAGTSLLADLAPQVSNFDSAARPAFSLNGLQLFSARTIAQGSGLWRTDGTSAGTEYVSGAAPIFGLTGVPTVQRNGAIFYPGLEPGGNTGLWRTDGTPNGTSRVQSFGILGVGGFASDTPGGCGIGFASLGNTFYFGVRMQSLGRLYRSDGSSGGTVELGSFPGSNGFGQTVCVLAAFSNELYFTAPDPATGVVVLWRSNGLAGGQARILAPSNSTFQAVVAMRQAGTALYFTARVDGIPGLWRIAGAGAQPTLVMQYPGNSFTALTPNGWMESLESVVVYPVCSNSGCRLARSDGTAAGTFELSPNVPFFFQPWSYLVYDGKLLFQGGDASGFEPWITDGSVAGTRLVKDLVPGLESSKPRDFINFNGLAYFHFDVIQNGTASTQLWRTDGTEAGTERVNTTPSISGTSQNGLFPQVISPPFGVAGDRLFFPAWTQAIGTELYKVENEAPAVAADTATTPAGTAVTVGVLGNDSDPDGTLLNSSMRIAQAPANGSTTIDAVSGSIRYTPNAGFSGTDAFTYQVADRQGRFSAPAGVNITVVAATVGGGGGGGSGGGSSGGGGPVGVLSLLAMAALAAGRRRCRGTNA